VRHLCEWPILAENRWPHIGRKLTPNCGLGGERLSGRWRRREGGPTTFRRETSLRPRVCKQRRLAPVVVGEVGRRGLRSDPAEGAFVCARAVVGYNRGGPPMATPTRCASTHREVVLTGLYEGVTR
jgi:hypothetical protein